MTNDQRDLRVRPDGGAPAPGLGQSSPARSGGQPGASLRPPIPSAQIIARLATRKAPPAPSLSAAASAWTSGGPMAHTAATVRSP